MPRIAVAQTVCAVGDVERNLRQATELIAEARGRGADLVVLPECFDVGLAFSRLGELASPIPGRTTDALCAAARAGGLWVVSGLVEREGDALYNAAVAVSPQGQIVARYRKCYLYLSEADLFGRGREACVVDLGFATAGLTICYDYIFPEYIRELVVRGSQVILHCTAWVDTEDCRRLKYPAAEAYRAQNRVRALENGVYFASANHSGAYDETGALQAVGHSMVVAPWGEVLTEVESGPGVGVAELDFAKAKEWAEGAAPYMRDYRTVARPQ